MKRVFYIFITLLLIISGIANFGNVQANEETTNHLENEIINKEENFELAEGEEHELTPRAAMTGSALNYPGVEVVDNVTGASNGRIPGSYASFMRLSTQSKYTVVGATSSNSTRARFDRFSTEAADGNPHYVEISHVAVYRGKDVDVRVNIENMLGTTSASYADIYTPTRLTSADFLRIFFIGRGNDLTIRYEFLDHATGEKIPYKGTWLIKRLNSHKNITLDTSPEHLKSIFVSSNSALQFETNDDFKTTKFSSTNSSTAVNNAANQMMFSFNASDGYTRKIYSPNGTGRNHIYYDSEAVAPLAVAFPSIIGQVNEEYPRVSYKIVQDYPAQNYQKHYPKRLKITVQLDKILKMDEVKFKVLNLQQQDVSERFTVTSNKEKSQIYFELDEATLSDENFANNTYTIEVESEIDWNISNEDYVKADGYFHIPATVKMESDINNSPIEQSIAKTKYIKGYANVEYLLVDDMTELIPTEQYEGEIGQSYLFEPKEIAKYELIKTVGVTSGIFEKETKLIQFIYARIPNKAPVLTLDQQSDEAVINDGTDFIISGQVSDEDSEKINVYYTLDGGEPIEIAQFTQVLEEHKSFNYEAVIEKKFIADGEKHRITVFAVDSEDAISLEKSVTLQAFTGDLQFISIPNEVTFGGNPVISTKDKVYYVIDKTQDLVVEDTRLESKGWQLSVQLVKPLTSASGEVIKDAVRYNDDVMKIQEATKIFEQKELHNTPINISKDWVDNEEGLNIIIPAGVGTAETYTTEMQWVLEDIPEN